MRQNVLSFQLNENYVQDINETAEEKLVQDEVKIGQFVRPHKYSSISSVRHMKYVQDISDLPETDYETLWECVFTLDPILAEHNEIWHVQNETEPRRSMMLHQRGG